MNREAELFSEAVELDPSERRAYVARVCGDNAILRATVEALLRGHEKAQRVFAAPVADRPNLGMPAEKPGDVIDRYTLLEKIGEGGCGVVWRAEQREPVRREVALKVIKLGMDTREVIARFEAERQALALMDHANIAKVLDGGSTDSGRPFFVMELVRGVPITRFCDEANLSTTARLKLFIDVCHAIQHAHQKGIIHRDLKPSNVLVGLHDDVPVAKVIDFGIAKATQGRLTDQTFFTAFEQFIGTPAYMSPEQAAFNALDIDTRSDVYSLGVLLYELLTGRPPFDPKSLVSTGLDEIRRIIREVDPPRPSMRLTTLDEPDRATIAKQRAAAPAQLSMLLRGDLDWIVMRCLEKSRARRYETANGLAMDLQRHLRHEPVVARPPSHGYLLQKLVRRHRVAFSSAAAIAAVLVLGATVSTWLAIRAMRAEREQSRLRANETDLRRHAEAQERKAREAEQEQKRLRLVEGELRVRAEAQELATRRRAYAADMQLAQQAIKLDNFVRAQELLNRHKPFAGQLDLRGWEWRHLWQQSRGEFVDTVCHRPDKGVLSVAVSADGDSLAMVASERLAIWNLPKRKESVVPIQAMGRVAFAPRGPLLAATARRWNEEKQRPEQRVILWNTQTNEIAAEITTGGPSGGLFFSNDGEILVTAAGRGTAAWSQALHNKISLWRVSDGAHLRSFNASITSRYQYTTAFAVARDLSIAAHGAIAARGAEGRNLRVIDLNTGDERWVVRDAVAEGNNVTALAISPDGKWVASGGGGSDTTIGLWDATSGKLLRRFEGHRNWIASLLFWPDGKTLASASMDRTIRVWDVQSGKTLKTLRGHGKDVWSLALLADNTTLASGGKEGAVYLWDTATTSPPSSCITLPQPVEAWRFSADGKSILSVDTEGSAVLWHGAGFSEKTALMAVGPIERGEMWDQLIAISPDLRHIVFRPRDARAELQLWDVVTRRLRRTFTVSAGAMSIPAEFPDAESLFVYDQRDVTGLLCREWDLQGDRERRVWRLPLKSPPNSALQVRFSPDRRLWLMRSDGDAVAYSTDTGNSTTLRLAILGPGIPQFSPDGRLFAIAGMGSVVTKLWETSTYGEVATLAGIFRVPHSATFSPDGDRLAVGAGGSEAIVLWDVKTHEALLSLEGSHTFFYRPAFSPDGRYIGARNNSAGNGILHLWRAPSWDEIAAAEKAQVSTRTP